MECECTDVQVPRLRSVSGRNLCPVKLLVVPEEVKVLRERKCRQVSQCLPEPEPARSWGHL